MDSFAEMTLAVYRVREAEGKEIASRMNLYETLKDYEPIESEEHLDLMLKADGGLQWGNLKPFGELVISGLPIPICIRKHFKEMINGNCHYGYSIKVEIQSGGKKNTPFEKRKMAMRNMSIRSTYYYMMEEVGNNRNQAARIRDKVGKIFGVTDFNMKKIIASKKEKEDRVILGIIPSDLQKKNEVH